jgi:hypothetical protein
MRDKTFVITMEYYFTSHNKCFCLRQIERDIFTNKYFNARFDGFTVVLTEAHLFWDWVCNTESRCKHLATFVRNLILQFSGCD